MKNFIIKILPIIFLWLSFIVSFYACDRDDIFEGPIVPQFSTIAVENITEVGATSGIFISNVSYPYYTRSIGVIFSKLGSDSLDVDFYRTSSLYKEYGFSQGVYLMKMWGLDPNTEYSLKSFMSYYGDVVYGNEISFTTQPLVHGTITDIEGNAYQTVQIGSQVWMSENLKTTKYNDGTDILYIPDASEWEQTESGAYAWLGNNFENKDIFGALYNWYVIETDKLCPQGWRVPSDDDWKKLEAMVDQGFYCDTIWDRTGMRGYNVGYRLKTTEGWYGPGNGSDVLSFSAKPAGVRSQFGDYYWQNSYAQFWTSTEDSGQEALSRAISYYYNSIGRYVHLKNLGYSVRCIKDD